MEKLTMQEEEVMIYIWELESCYVKDIVAKFEQPTPPYTRCFHREESRTEKICKGTACRKHVSVHSVY